VISDMKLVDCTIREAGYQTGWFFDKKFVCDWYRLLVGARVDYMELGFFHDEKSDPGKGIYRYGAQKNNQLLEELSYVKTTTKFSSMLDLQRPLSDILPQKDTLFDMVRIINRSHENDNEVLGPKVEELQAKGYKVSINYTSAGNNSRELNRSFLEFSKSLGVEAVYFADTESLFDNNFVESLIEDCNDLGVNNYGLHFHDKRGLAGELMEVAFRQGCRRFDATLMGFGGKWQDWNLAIESVFKRFHVDIDPVEFNNARRDLVRQLIKYNEFDTTIIE
jgi:4-hydroxy 2-oxovalerate aldolase